MNIPKVSYSQVVKNRDLMVDPHEIDVWRNPQGFRVTANRRADSEYCVDQYTREEAWSKGESLQTRVDRISRETVFGKEGRASFITSDEITVTGVYKTLGKGYITFATDKYAHVRIYRNKVAKFVAQLLGSQSGLFTQLVRVELSKDTSEEIFHIEDEQQYQKLHRVFDAFNREREASKKRLNQAISEIQIWRQQTNDPRPSDGSFQDPYYRIQRAATALQTSNVRIKIFQERVLDFENVRQLEQSQQVRQRRGPVKPLFPLSGGGLLDHNPTL